MDDAHVEPNYDSDEHIACVLEHLSNDGELDITWDTSVLQDLLFSDQAAADDYAEQSILFVRNCNNVRHSKAENHSSSKRQGACMNTGAQKN